MEEWRDIPGYEGKYQASSEGRVRSLPRYVRAVSKAGREYERFVEGCVLRPGLSRGYYVVNLLPGGNVAVHLVVARAFFGPVSEGLQVNHKNGVKANCSLTNLEIVTKSENQLHAVRFGLNTQATPVTDGVSVWPSASQAAFEVTGERRRGAEISRHLRGERAAALGRVWSYA